MAVWHLLEIENHLHQIGWSVEERLDGDGIAISEAWIIHRKTNRQLDFHGMDVMTGRLLEHPIFCQINGTKIALYFYRKGKMWDKALAEFIKELNKLD